LENAFRNIYSRAKKENWRYIRNMRDGKRNFCSSICTTEYNKWISFTAHLKKLAFLKNYNLYMFLFSNLLSCH
jgi:hypothetical protein